MVKYDFSSLLDINSMIISGGTKSGKITFALYLIAYFYKEDALIFTPQESYLFNKKIETLSKQFNQFSDIKNKLQIYHTLEDFANLKQKYGYDFLLKELENIIINAKEKIIVLNRIAEFFDFQDRHEIDNFYKFLVKTAEINNKKIIFIANNKNKSFKYIYQIAEEVSDMTIKITKNEKNERILNIMNLLNHQEYPLLNFKINDENFLLEYEHETAETRNKKIKNILIAELDKTHDNIRQICSYIFNKPNFTVKHADSLQKILQEIFIRPELIIILMKRNQNNLETIKAIKMQLPNTAIVTILDQDFVRTEDIQELINYGSDDIFTNNLTFDTVILSLQRTTKTLFYTDMVNSLTKYNNIMSNLDDFKQLAIECVDKSIFFTAFVLEDKVDFPKLSHTSRRTDYIFQDGKKLYYLAINTMPKDIYIIIKKFKKSNPDIEFTCIWEPINNVAIEECIR